MSSHAQDDPREETWLDLEKLAALIYAELEPTSTVTHNATLDGKLSRSPRQIDVLIESPENQTRVVVDCKDWARRVNVVDVGAFATLVEDVEATSGVLICNKCFSEAAKTLAANKGVSLCQLHDVASRRSRVRDPSSASTASVLAAADATANERARLAVATIPR